MTTITERITAAKNFRQERLDRVKKLIDLLAVVAGRIPEDITARAALKTKTFPERRLAIYFAREHIKVSPSDLAVIFNSSVSSISAVHQETLDFITAYTVIKDQLP